MSWGGARGAGKNCVHKYTLFSTVNYTTVEGSIRYVKEDELRAIGHRELGIGNWECTRYQEVGSRRYSTVVPGTRRQVQTQINNVYWYVRTSSSTIYEYSSMYWKILRPTASN